MKTFAVRLDDGNVHEAVPENCIDKQPGEGTGPLHVGDKIAITWPQIFAGANHPAVITGCHVDTMQSLKANPLDSAAAGQGKAKETIDELASKRFGKAPSADPLGQRRETLREKLWFLDQSELVGTSTSLKKGFDKGDTFAILSHAHEKHSSKEKEKRQAKEARRTRLSSGTQQGPTVKKRKELLVAQANGPIKQMDKHNTIGKVSNATKKATVSFEPDPEHPEKLVCKTHVEDTSTTVAPYATAAGLQYYNKTALQNEIAKVRLRRDDKVANGELQREEEEEERKAEERRMAARELPDAFLQGTLMVKVIGGVGIDWHKEGEKNGGGSDAGQHATGRGAAAAGASRGAGEEAPSRVQLMCLMRLHERKLKQRSAKAAGEWRKVRQYTHMAHNLQEREDDPSRASESTKGKTAHQLGYEDDDDLDELLAKSRWTHAIECEASSEKTFHPEWTQSFQMEASQLTEGGWLEFGVVGRRHHGHGKQMLPQAPPQSQAYGRKENKKSGAVGTVSSENGEGSIVGSGGKAKGCEAEQRGGGGSRRVSEAGTGSESGGGREEGEYLSDVDVAKPPAAGIMRVTSLIPGYTQLGAFDIDEHGTGFGTEHPIGKKTSTGGGGHQDKLRQASVDKAFEGERTPPRSTKKRLPVEVATHKLDEAGGHISTRLTAAASATAGSNSAAHAHLLSHDHGKAANAGKAYYSGEFEEIGVSSLHFGHLIFAAAYDDSPGGMREDLQKPHQMCISLGTGRGELYLSWRFLVLELPQYTLKTMETMEPVVPQRGSTRAIGQTVDTSTADDEDLGDARGIKLTLRLSGALDLLEPLFKHQQQVNAMLSHLQNGAHSQRGELAKTGLNERQFVRLIQGVVEGRGHGRGHGGSSGAAVDKYGQPVKPTNQHGHVDLSSVPLLFRKVDANLDGNVSWDELLEYLMHEYSNNWHKVSTHGTHYLEKGGELEEAVAQSAVMMLHGHTHASASMLNMIKQPKTLYNRHEHEDMKAHAAGLSQEKEVKAQTVSGNPHRRSHGHSFLLLLNGRGDVEVRSAEGDLALQYAIDIDSAPPPRIVEPSPGLSCGDGTSDSGGGSGGGRDGGSRPASARFTAYNDRNGQKVKKQSQHQQAVERKKQEAKKQQESSIRAGKRGSPAGLINWGNDSATGRLAVPSTMPSNMAVAAGTGSTPGSNSGSQITRRVTCLAYSEELQHVAVGLNDRTVRLYDLSVTKSFSLTSDGKDLGADRGVGSFAIHLLRDEWSASASAICCGPGIGSAASGMLDAAFGGGKSSKDDGRMAGGAKQTEKRPEKKLYWYVGTTEGRLLMYDAKTYKLVDSLALHDGSHKEADKAEGGAGSVEPAKNRSAEPKKSHLRNSNRGVRRLKMCEGLGLVSCSMDHSLAILDEKLVLLPRTPEQQILQNKAYQALRTRRARRAKEGLDLDDEEGAKGDVMLNVKHLPMVDNLSVGADETSSEYGHKRGVTCFDWSAERHFLVSGSFDRRALVWEPHNPRHPVTALGAQSAGGQGSHTMAHPSTIVDVVINDVTNHIVTASEAEAMVKVWDSRTLGLLQILTNGAHDCLSALVLSTPFRSGDGFGGDKRGVLYCAGAVLSTWRPVEARYKKAAGEGEKIMDAGGSGGGGGGLHEVPEEELLARKQEAAARETRKRDWERRKQSLGLGQVQKVAAAEGPASGIAETGMTTYHGSYGGATTPGRPATAPAAGGATVAAAAANDASERERRKTAMAQTRLNWHRKGNPQLRHEGRQMGVAGAVPRKPKLHGKLVPPQITSEGAPSAGATSSGRPSTAPAQHRAPRQQQRPSTASGKVGFGTMATDAIKPLHVREVLEDSYKQQPTGQSFGENIGIAPKMQEGGAKARAAANAAAQAKAKADEKLKLLAPPYVEEVLSVHYSAEFDQFVAVASNGYIRVWNMDFAEPAFLFQASAAAPAGPLVAASGAGDGDGDDASDVPLMVSDDTDHSSSSGTRNPLEDMVTACCLDGTGRRLVVGGHTGGVSIWNFNNGNLLAQCPRLHVVKEVGPKLSSTEAQPSAGGASAAQGGVSAAQGALGGLLSLDDDAGEGAAETARQAVVRRTSIYGPATGIARAPWRSDTVAAAATAVAGAAGSDEQQQQRQQQQHRSYNLVAEAKEVGALLYVQSKAVQYPVISGGWAGAMAKCTDAQFKAKGGGTTLSKRMQGHTDDVTALETCGPRLVASGDFTGNIILWYVGNGKVKTRCKLPRLPIHRLHGGRWKTNTSDQVSGASARGRGVVSKSRRTIRSGKDKSTMLAQNLRRAADKLGLGHHQSPPQRRSSLSGMEDGGGRSTMSQGVQTMKYISNHKLSHQLHQYHQQKSRTGGAATGESEYGLLLVGTDLSHIYTIDVSDGSFVHAFDMLRDISSPRYTSWIESKEVRGIRRRLRRGSDLSGMGMMLGVMGGTKLGDKMGIGKMGMGMGKGLAKGVQTMQSDGVDQEAAAREEREMEAELEDAEMEAEVEAEMREEMRSGAERQATRERNKYLRMVRQEEREQEQQQMREQVDSKGGGLKPKGVQFGTAAVSGKAQLQPEEDDDKEDELVDEDSSDSDDEYNYADQEEEAQGYTRAYHMLAERVRDLGEGIDEARKECIVHEIKHEIKQKKAHLVAVTEEKGAEERREASKKRLQDMEAEAEWRRLRVVLMEHQNDRRRRRRYRRRALKRVKERRRRRKEADAEGLGSEWEEARTAEPTGRVAGGGRRGRSTSPVRKARNASTVGRGRQQKQQKQQKQQRQQKQQKQQTGKVGEKKEDEGEGETGQDKFWVEAWVGGSSSSSTARAGNGAAGGRGDGRGGGVGSASSAAVMITAMATNEACTTLCVGNSDGWVMMFNLELLFMRGASTSANHTTLAPPPQSWRPNSGKAKRAEKEAAEETFPEMQVHLSHPLSFPDPFTWWRIGPIKTETTSTGAGAAADDAADADAAIFSAMNMSSTVNAKRGVVSMTCCDAKLADKKSRHGNNGRGNGHAGSPDGHPTLFAGATGQMVQLWDVEGIVTLTINLRQEWPDHEALNLVNVSKALHPKDTVAHQRRQAAETNGASPSKRAQHDDSGTFMTAVPEHETIDSNTTPATAENNVASSRLLVGTELVRFERTRKQKWVRAVIGHRQMLVQGHDEREKRVAKQHSFAYAFASATGAGCVTGMAAAFVPMMLGGAKQTSLAHINQHTSMAAEDDTSGDSNAGLKGPNTKGAMDRAAAVAAASVAVLEDSDGMVPYVQRHPMYNPPSLKRGSNMTLNLTQLIDKFGIYDSEHEKALMAPKRPATAPSSTAAHRQRYNGRRGGAGVSVLERRLEKAEREVKQRLEKEEDNRQQQQQQQQQHGTPSMTKRKARYGGDSPSSTPRGGQRRTLLVQKSTLAGDDSGAAPRARRAALQGGRGRTKGGSSGRGRGVVFRSS
jgi:WD40 repeat protein